MKCLFSIGLAVAITAIRAPSAEPPTVPAPVLSKPEAAPVMNTNGPASAAAPTASTNGPGDAAAPAASTNEVPPQTAELPPQRDSLARFGPVPVEQFIVARGQAHLPTSEHWKHGMGGEVQWRRWYTPSWGVALVAGYQRWTVETHAFSFDEPHVLKPELDGSAGLVPAGLSVLFQTPEPSGSMRFAAELGLRYAWAVSDASVSYRFINHYGQETLVRDTISLDDRLLLVAAVEAGRRLDGELEWLVFGGYQFDFTKGENWLYEELANDFGGVVVGAGLRRRF